jgi:hypothetical protein
MAAKRGLIFLYNEDEGEGGIYLKTMVFRYIPTFRKLVYFIRIKLFQNNICEISFYPEVFQEKSDEKYQLRTNYGHAVFRAVLLGCLEAYNYLKEDYAILFHAANDIDIVMEDNDRNSAYKLFLSHHLENYSDYIQKGSLKYNTLLMYHKSFQYKDEAESFFSREYEPTVIRKVEDQKNKLGLTNS